MSVDLTQLVKNAPKKKVKFINFDFFSTIQIYKILIINYLYFRVSFVVPELT